ncbi:MAG: F0F1 ATP synthase subunit epsilon [Chloroflexi bacterium]|jgi:F-type H+-transporting ATPase subunit epsilon|nr:F0F1 ATP synthase subunit epsilon [Dehalococcoidia bacterium]MCO5200644.1 F0F1 ATP synthase subunit epsilon [Chloroflexota bacterium]MCZ7578328.1 F0F1 ATP synthase subunit epsilon [Dehalococcoidia bacterium]NJD65315.1 F0F1 ATP synthase subunit epsilon [Chloroflexota bacterium]PWB45253.1 MAG: ATP synthase F1 subunit epsilon [Dehalococcoidia bacterium]
MPLTVELVTAERVVRVEQGVDVLVVPGSEGQMAILPHHAALMTTLDPGELVMRRAGQEDAFAVTGGFLEVRNDRVTVLADAAEPFEEIDATRAEAARARAEERLRLYREGRAGDVDVARAAAALQRSLMRLRIVQRRRRPGPPRV